MSEVKEIQEEVITTDDEEIKKENIAQENDEEQQEKIETNTKKNFLQKYVIVITITSIILFIGLAIFSTAFGLAIRNSNKIINGILINNIDISGLTYNEAKEKLTSLYNAKITENIAIIHNNYEVNFSPEEINASFGINESIDIAYSVGRSGKLLKDNYTIIYANLGKININPSFTYNEENITKIINSTIENMPDKVVESSYVIENDKLIIKKGIPGYCVNDEELKSLILDNIISIKAEKVDIPVFIKEPDSINIEKIHEEIYKEAKDAYYTETPFTIYPHVIGIDFAVTMEEAKSIVNSEDSVITIPLKLTIPNVTINQIGIEAFPDVLATYTTSFSTANVNRTTNIKLASEKINGVVLMPDEEFSYNKVVGERTAAGGFKAAAAYSGGKVVSEIGGGICQVSSTLYNAALRSNLEIIDRSNHRFATGYVPLSTDATVSWGGPEFIFKNTRRYPIKIGATVNGNKIKVEIYGCKEEVEYDVIIQSETIQVIPMKTEYRVNPNLPAGTTKTVQTGHAGYKSRAYRILKLNGEIISKQLLSTDTYAQLSTIIETN